MNQTSKLKKKKKKLKLSKKVEVRKGSPEHVKQEINDNKMILMKEVLNEDLTLLLREKKLNQNLTNAKVESLSKVNLIKRLKRLILQFVNLKMSSFIN